MPNPRPTDSQSPALNELQGWLFDQIEHIKRDVEIRYSEPENRYYVSLCQGQRPAIITTGCGRDLPAAIHAALLGAASWPEPGT